MTIFEDKDFVVATTHDGFSSRDKDFVAALEDYIVQPLGKKDSIAVSLRFSDDPEGEQLLSIFGIDGADKNGSYNKKIGWGAFIESMAKVGVKVLVAKKVKEGTNKDDPAYDYAIKFDPQLKGTGRAMTMHVDKSKYTKDGVEKESTVWTCTGVSQPGAVPATPASSPENNDKLIEAWRELMCDPEKVKLLGLPGTKKNLILNLKKVIPDEKTVGLMQTVRDSSMDILAKEGIVKIESGIITPL